MNIYRPEWQEQAACRGMNPNIFMPGRGEHGVIKRAQKICNSCPVIQQCRNYGLQLEADGLLFGIFGGLTQFNRQQILQEERRTGKPSAARTITPGLNATHVGRAS